MTEKEKPKFVDSIRELPIAELVPNTAQPRKSFPKADLEKLARSIQATGGVIQPVVVHQPPGSYGWEIIAGERRWRACMLLGLRRIPCRILPALSDLEKSQLALLENLDRADLSPIEIGLALARMADSHNLTHDRIADLTGMSRTAVTRHIGYTHMHPETQEALHVGHLSPGQAKLVMSLPHHQQLMITRQALAKNWTVRQTQAAIAKETGAATEKNHTAESRDKDTEPLVRAFGERLGAACSLRQLPNGQWELSIASYYPLELVGALEKFSAEVEKKGKRKGPVKITVSGSADVFDFLADEQG